MKYQDVETKKIELIWNSRDGVTPFVVFSRDGNESRHVDWRSDQIVPDHVPSVGDRIFIDLTMERCREFHRQMVEERWEREPYPMKDRFASKEEAVERLSVEMFGNGRQPDIIEVTEDIRLGFLTKKESSV